MALQVQISFKNINIKQMLKCVQCMKKNSVNALDQFIPVDDDDISTLSKYVSNAVNHSNSTKYQTRKCSSTNAWYKGTIIICHFKFQI